MSDQWTEGEPSEDGLHACECSDGFRVLRRDGDVFRCSGPTWGYKPILRHIRLPEPSKPLDQRALRAAKSIRAYLAEPQPQYVPNDVWEYEAAKIIHQAYTQD